MERSRVSFEINGMKRTLAVSCLLVLVSTQLRAAKPADMAGVDFYLKFNVKGTALNTARMYIDPSLNASQNSQVLVLDGGTPPVFVTDKVDDSIYVVNGGVSYGRANSMTEMIQSTWTRCAAFTPVTFTSLAILLGQWNNSSVAEKFIGVENGVATICTDGSSPKCKGGARPLVAGALTTVCGVVDGRPGVMYRELYVGIGGKITREYHDVLGPPDFDYNGGFMIGLGGSGGTNGPFNGYIYEVFNAKSRAFSPGEVHDWMAGWMGPGAVAEMEN